LSNHEIEYLKTFISGHGQIQDLFVNRGYLDRRNVYWFFDKFGGVGVDLCIFSVADLLASSRLWMGKSQLKDLLSIITTLLNAYLVEKITAQEPFINGEQIMSLLNLKAGPELGRALKLLREEQAIGNIKSKEDAKQLLQNWSTYKRPNEKND